MWPTKLHQQKHRRFSKTLKGQFVRKKICENYQQNIIIRISNVCGDNLTSRSDFKCASNKLWNEKNCVENVCWLSAEHTKWMTWYFFIADNFSSTATTTTTTLPPQSAIVRVRLLKLYLCFSHFFSFGLSSSIKANRHQKTKEKKTKIMILCHWAMSTSFREITV